MTAAPDLMMQGGIKPFEQHAVGSRRSSARRSTRGGRPRPAQVNAWALDGYLKVFWRDSPIWALWPQVVVLSTLTAVFMTLARTFARRWEAA
jgi:hypothetical protein